MEYQSGAVSPVGSIQRGWDIIKNDYWTFFLMSLVAGIILFAVSLIVGLIGNGINFAIFAAFGAVTQNAGEAGRISGTIATQIIAMGVSFITNILVFAVWGALSSGIYSSLARKVTTGQAEFGDMFAGFQNFVACLIAGAFVSLVNFVLGLLMVVVLAAFGFSIFGLAMLGQKGQIDPAALGGLIGIIAVVAVLSIVVHLIIFALTTFIFPLIGERRLPGWDASLLGLKSGLGNLLSLMLFGVLLGLMMIGGFFACLIGILFVAPLIYASIFAAYESVLGLDRRESFRYEPPAPPTFGRQPGY